MRTILLVDDHDQARKRMRALVEEVFKPQRVVESATLYEASRHIAQTGFDLVVLDLSLPDGDGESLIASILAKNSNSYIVISSVHDEGMRLVKALSLGARGYLLKDQSIDTIRSALQGMQVGIPPISASVTRRILEYLRQSNIENKPSNPSAPARSITASGSADASVTDKNQLTPREAEILTLLARGLNRPDIAGILNISKHTVATHVTNVYSKLSISTRSEAAMSARDLGLT